MSKRHTKHTNFLGLQTTKVTACIVTQEISIILHESTSQDEGKTLGIN